MTSPVRQACLFAVQQCKRFVRAAWAASQLRPTARALAGGCVSPATAPAFASCSSAAALGPLAWPKPPALRCAGPCRLGAPARLRPSRAPVGSAAAAGGWASLPVWESNNIMFIIIEGVGPVALFGLCVYTAIQAWQLVHTPAVSSPIRQARPLRGSTMRAGCTSCNGGVAAPPNGTRPCRRMCVAGLGAAVGVMWQRGRRAAAGVAQTSSSPLHPPRAPAASTAASGSEPSRPSWLAAVWKSEIRVITQKVALFCFGVYMAIKAWKLVSTSVTPAPRRKTGDLGRP